LGPRAELRPSAYARPGTSERPSLTRFAMAKLTTPVKTAEMLSVRERVLLFCAASRTDWLQAGVTLDIVTHMLMVGLISRDAAGAVALTDRGRAVYNAMLPEPRPCSPLVPEPPERDPLPQRLSNARVVASRWLRSVGHRRMSRPGTMPA
jgi:hypothetical protein